MKIKESLAEIVGHEYVSDDPKGLVTYSKDHSLKSPGMPNYVVQPKGTEEVQKVIKLANENKMPIIPTTIAMK